MAISTRSGATGITPPIINLVCEDEELTESQREVYRLWEIRVKEYDGLMKKHKEEEDKYQKAVKAVDSRVGLKDTENLNTNGPTKFLRSVPTSSPQPISKPVSGMSMLLNSTARVTTNTVSQPGVASYSSTAAVQKSVVNGKQQLSYGGNHLLGRSSVGLNPPGVRMVISTPLQSQRPTPTPAPLNNNFGVVRSHGLQNGMAKQLSKPQTPGVSWSNSGTKIVASVMQPNSRNGNPSFVLSNSVKQNISVYGSKPPQQPVISSQAANTLKRPAESSATQDAKRTKADVIDYKTLVNYYPFKKGRILATEDGSRRFKIKCFHCNDTMSSNIQYATHVRKIVESQLSDASVLNTVCSQCFKRFRTPYEKQEHQERSHLKGAVYQCFTCDLSFNNNTALVRHMDVFHGLCQMPFHCTICQFRTSAYADIMEHFSMKHEGYKALMCPYCLKMLRCSKTYLQHCQKHIQGAMRASGGVYPCKNCKLSFLSTAERTEHIEKDHKKYDIRFRDGVPRYVRDTLKSLEIMASAGITGTAPNSVPALTLVKSIAPTPVRSAAPTSVGSAAPGVMRACMECGQQVEHFDKHLRSRHSCSVSLCKYSTFCSASFDKHTLYFHKTPAGRSDLKPFIGTVKKKRNLDRSLTLICKVCNYSTRVPTHMAHHRAKKCARRTPIEWISYLYVPTDQGKKIRTTKPTSSPKVANMTDVILLDSDEEA